MRWIQVSLACFVKAIEKQLFPSSPSLHHCFLAADMKAAEETSAYAGHNGISTEMKGGLGEDDTLLKDGVEEFPSLYQVNSLLSEPVVEKTTIKIEQTIEGEVKKHEPSEVIQPSASVSWVLGQTHIEIDHTTVMETAKPLSASLPEGLTSVPQSAKILPDAVKKTIGTYGGSMRRSCLPFFLP